MSNTEHQCYYINTEHECFHIDYMSKWYLLCSPKVYEFYLKFFKGKEMIVLCRDYSKEFTDDFYMLASTLRQEPYKQYYNAHPQWSDYAEVYIRLVEHLHDIFIPKYGDIDGFEGDMLVSIKPSQSSTDDNHRVYTRIESKLGIKWKIVYSN